jgi:hypothetical protein
MDICREMEPRLAPNPEDPEHMCACHMFTQKKEDK